MRPGSGFGEITHQVSLFFPANPFDHQDLLEAGYREWSRTSDALLSGRRLSRMLPLLREGLRERILTLALIKGVVQSEKPRLKGFSHHGFHEDGVGVPEPIAGGQDDGIPVVFDVDSISEVELHHSSLLSPNSIAQVLGFDILFVVNGWLSGALLYLKPEHRGQGLPEAYFRTVLALAKAKGLRGFRFLSTLHRWERCKIFHRELHLVQKDGTPVYAYWKAVS